MRLDVSVFTLSHVFTRASFICTHGGIMYEHFHRSVSFRTPRFDM